VRVGLELDGQAFGSVRVGVSTVFLRNELTPKLQQAAFSRSSQFFARSCSPLSSRTWLSAR